VGLRERDLFRQPLREDELRDLLGDVAPGEAFAWRSPRARAMHLDPANPLTDDELIRLMVAVPYLIRRPVVRIGGRTLFGPDQRRLEAALRAEGG